MKRGRTASRLGKINVRKISTKVLIIDLSTSKLSKRSSNKLKPILLRLRLFRLTPIALRTAISNVEGTKIVNFTAPIPSLNLFAFLVSPRCILLK